VNALFWTSYLLTDQVLEMFNKVKEYETLLAVAVLSGIAGVFIYKYVVGKRVTTGETENVPAVISKPVEAIEHAVEKAVEKVEHAVEKAVETVTGHHHPDDAKAPEVPPEAPAAGAGGPDDFNAAGLRVVGGRCDGGGALLRWEEASLLRLRHAANDSPLPVSFSGKLRRFMRGSLAQA
jgi:hypothetical protein